MSSFKTNYISLKHGFHLALTSGNFLANASELEYENFFIFSASYRSTSKEYRLVSARWKPCFIDTVYTCFQSLIAAHSAFILEINWSIP